MITGIPEGLKRKENEVLTSLEVAELLKVNIGSVRRWSRSGKLKGYRLGGYGDWRYLKEDVLAFLYSFNNIEGGAEGEENS